MPSYVVDFTLTCCGYLQPFALVFEARNEKHLNRRLNTYFEKCDGGHVKREGNVWWIYERVAVTMDGFEELRKPAALVAKATIR